MTVTFIDYRNLDYVAQKPCGCYVRWAAPKYWNLRADLAEWRARGWSIQRVTREAAERLVQGCEHGETT